MRGLEIEVRHFHLFCGLGGGARGFNAGSARLGSLRATFRCLGGVDSDARAVADFGRLAGVPGTVLDLFDRDQYRAFHGAEPPATWREAGVEDLRRAAGGESPDILFTSPPCLPANGSVLTPEGARAISTLRAGDLVLTHRGRYRPVRMVGRHRYSGEMFGLRLNGTVDTQWFTAEHPIWTRPVVRWYRNSRRRSLGAADFKLAQNVRVGHRVGFPIDPEIQGTARAFVASAGEARVVTKGGKSTGRYAKPEHQAAAPRVVDLTWAHESPRLWFVLGAYLGDGYRSEGEVALCVGPEGGTLFETLIEHLAFLGVGAWIDRTAGKTNVKIRVTARHLFMLCGLFGDGAARKDIPAALFNLERPLLEALVAGYRATDGSDQGRRTPAGGNELQARWRIASVSLPLLRSLQRLLLRLEVFGGINQTWGGGPQVIEGRTVQTRPRWELTVRLEPKKRATYEFADGAVWVRVRSVTRRPADEEVWNLDVEEDDTFCAPMMATHNCKGFSGLLPEHRSTSAKYQALNRLTVRSVMLALEAWAEDPPAFFLLENVPRIATRGRHFLEQIEALLRAAGYSVAETTHDCGELGGLGQHRRRFLLVARHREKVPPFLYEPPRRRVRSVGETIGDLALPDAPASGPMHRLPRISWDTWVRLALIPAGGDWRALRGRDFGRFRIVSSESRHWNQMRVVGWDEAAPTVIGSTRPGSGAASVADPRSWHRGVLGVRRWEDPSATVTGRAGATTGVYSVADPRNPDWGAYGQYGVRRWEEPSGAVTSQAGPGQGVFSIADPRPSGWGGRGKYRVSRFDEPAGAVIAASSTGNGAAAVADPRGWGGGPDGVVPWAAPSGAVPGESWPSNGRFSVADPRGPRFNNVFRVVRWEEASPAVTGGGAPSSGGLAIADPRRAGNYGVLPWGSPSGAVVGSSSPDAGSFSVADPRLYEPDEHPDPPPLLIALDDTWHRPFTTLELAVLQGFPPELLGGALVLEGKSHSRWREAVGNAVPPPTAAAIASVMGRALLAAKVGETFELSAEPVWVQPVAALIALEGAR